MSSRHVEGLGAADIEALRDQRTVISHQVLCMGGGLSVVPIATWPLDRRPSDADLQEYSDALTPLPAPPRDVWARVQQTWLETSDEWLLSRLFSWWRWSYDPRLVSLKLAHERWQAAAKLEVQLLSAETSAWWWRVAGLPSSWYYGVSWKEEKWRWNAETDRLAVLS